MIGFMVLLYWCFSSFREVEPEIQGKANVKFRLRPHFKLAHLFAAAAKSLQSCPTLCDPVDGRRIPRDRDSPGKNTGVGCHFSFVKNHLTMFVFIYL